MHHYSAEWLASELAGYDRDDGVKAPLAHQGSLSRNGHHRHGKEFDDKEKICEPGKPGASGLLELIGLSMVSRTLRNALARDEMWEPYLSRLEKRFPKCCLGDRLHLQRDYSTGYEDHVYIEKVIPDEFLVRRRKV